jgi:hypothetical protein
MQDPYAGQAGSYLAVDGIRIPAEDSEVYHADKAAYLADREAAIEAFKNKGAKSESKAKARPQTAQQPEAE